MYLNIKQKGIIYQVSLSSIYVLSRSYISTAIESHSLAYGYRPSACRSWRGLFSPILIFLFALDRLCSPSLDVFAFLGLSCVSGGSFSREELIHGRGSSFSRLAVRIWRGRAV